MKYRVLLLGFSFCALVCSPQSSHAQWIAMNGPPGGSVGALAVSGSNLLAGTSGGSVYLSPDDGTTWTQLKGPGASVTSLAVRGSNLFAGTWLGGVFVSTNGGATWTTANSGLDPYVYSLATSGTRLLAGTTTGVYRTTNDGVTWAHTLITGHVPGLVLSGTFLFAGIDGSGVFRSADDGVSWTPVNTGLANLHVLALTVSGTNLIAGTLGGAFVSPDNGASWTAASQGLTNYSFTSLAVSGTSVFAGFHNYGGVFLTTNGGALWAAINSGLGPSPSVWSLVVSGANIFAGMDGNVWRRSLSEVAAVEQTSAQVPVKCVVYQNAPNPFNRSTAIAFALPQAMHVTLNVYSLLGERVASVLSEDLPAGTYRTNWDATGIASGVYLYRLQAGSYRETRKLVVMR